MKHFNSLIFLLCLITVSPAFAQRLSVMTYNIRFDNPKDGINQWSSRKEKVFKLLKKYQPDAFGVQEALHHQLEDIKNALSGYDYVGAGRDDGKQKGEYSAIFYRTDKFELKSSETFWLSKTPEVPGSKDWDAAITRVVTWARFLDKKSKKEFALVNTHFDHIGKEARLHSAEIIREKVTTLSGSYPVIITGDFNCQRDEEPYQTMVNGKGVLLVDTAPKNPEGTFCNFGVNSMKCTAIDYIFTTAEWKIKNYRVIKDNDGKNYPSDHLPVMVDLSVK